MKVANNCTPVLVEYHGQLCTGYLIRKLAFMRRVRLDVKGGKYRLVWVPAWRTNL